MAAETTTAAEMKTYTVIDDPHEFATVYADHVEKARSGKAEREQEALREACRAEHRVSVRYDAGRHYPYTPACSHCGDLSWGYAAEHAAQLIADDHAAQWAPERGN